MLYLQVISQTRLLQPIDCWWPTICLPYIGRGISLSALFKGASNTLDGLFFISILLSTNQEYCIYHLKIFLVDLTRNSDSDLLTFPDTVIFVVYITTSINKFFCFYITTSEKNNKIYI